MKKIILLLLLVTIFKQPIISQTIIWENDFTDPGVGWELGEHWDFFDDNLLLMPYPHSQNYSISVVSPLIYLPDNSSMLGVNQLLDINTNYVTDEIAEISIIHNGNEEIIWSYACVNGTWGVAGGDTILFDLSNYANKSIQIKFASSGATTQAWYEWKIFNMYIYSYFDNEIMAINTVGPKVLEPGTAGTWHISVKNNGANSISNFNIGLYCNRTASMLVSQTISEPLASEESASYSIDWTPTNPINTTLSGHVYHQNDEFSGNNYAKPNFLRVKTDETYNILLVDMDNGNEIIVNPETGQLEECQQGIENALMRAGFEYDYEAYKIPDNVNDYDIVILELGSYGVC